MHLILDCHKNGTISGGSLTIICIAAISECKGDFHLKLLMNTEAGWNDIHLKFMSNVFLKTIFLNNAIRGNAKWKKNIDESD